jgi:hypothetical protein
MGQTPKYGLRFPERSDPAEAWTTVGNLAADVETMYQGAAAVPVAASGWAWWGADGYGQGIAIRAGRVVTVDGLLRRTGGPVTLTNVPLDAVTVPWAADPSRTFTGESFLLTGAAARWYFKGGTTSLQLLAAGASGATIATNGAVAFTIRYILAP